MLECHCKRKFEVIHVDDIDLYSSKKGYEMMGVVNEESVYVGWIGRRKKDCTKCSRTGDPEKNISKKLLPFWIQNEQFLGVAYGISGFQQDVH